MAATYDYDLVVIGSGSAGFAAARTAVALGAKVAVVAGGKEIVGLCITAGCMPSKTFLESAHRWHEIKRAGEFGLEAKGIAVDMRAIQERKKRLVEDFATYRAERLEHGNFDLIRAKASFQGPHSIFLKGSHKGPRTITGATFLISTGSVIRCVNVPGLTEVGYITSDEALMTDKLPATLAVLGGGVIAAELGQFYARLGTKVTILQRGSHILRTYSEDVSMEIERAFAAEGIDVHTGTKLVRVEKAGLKKKVTYEQDGARSELIVDEILCAMGRDPAIDKLALENANVKVKGSCLVLNESLATTTPHIFAAGDVTGLHEVVHIAIQQGEIAARNAVRLVKHKREPQEKADYRLKALVTFTEPEIASVGLTEAEAKEKKIDYIAAKYPFADHGKSMVMGEQFGFVKLIAEKKRGEIIGAEFIGPHAADMIHELIAVMFYRGTAADVAVMPHYHPTLAEIVTYPAEEIVDKLAKK